MISQKKFLEIVYEAATCFIRHEEFDEEQIEAFDNISYRLCDCKNCRKAHVSGEDVSDLSQAGHADKYLRTIRISRVFVKSLLGDTFMSCIPIGLLQLIKVVLHEICHIVYPEFAEMDVEDKVMEWLKSFDWTELKNRPSDWGKKYKRPVHSRKDIPRSRLEDAEHVLDFWQGMMDRNPERPASEALIRIISEAEQKVNDLKHIIKWKEDYRKKHVAGNETPL